MVVKYGDRDFQAGFYVPDLNAYLPGAVLTDALGNPYTAADPLPIVAEAGKPFQIGAVTATITAGTTTGRVAILGIAGNSQITVTAPTGTTVAFIRFGNTSVVATVTDTPILPGTVQVFTVPSDVTHVAGITAADTAVLYFTPGNGY